MFTILMWFLVPVLIISLIVNKIFGEKAALNVGETLIWIGYTAFVACLAEVLYLVSFDPHARMYTWLVFEGPVILHLGWRLLMQISVLVENPKVEAIVEEFDRQARIISERNAFAQAEFLKGTIILDEQNPFSTEWTGELENWDSTPDKMVFFQKRHHSASGSSSSHKSDPYGRRPPEPY